MIYKKIEINTNSNLNIEKLINMCGINIYNLFLEQDYSINGIETEIKEKVIIKYIFNDLKNLNIFKKKVAQMDGLGSNTYFTGPIINFSIELNEFIKIPNKIRELIYEKHNPEFDDSIILNNLPNELKYLTIISRIETIFNLPNLPTNLTNLTLYCYADLNYLPENLKSLVIGWSKSNSYKVEDFINLPQGLENCDVHYELYNYLQKSYINTQINIKKFNNNIVSNKYTWNNKVRDIRIRL